MPDAKDEVDGTVPLHRGATHAVRGDLGGCRVWHLRFPPGLELAPHVHDRAGIVIVLRGAFDGHVGRRERSAAPASVLTEPLGEPHDNRFRRTGGEVVVLQPDPGPRVLPDRLRGTLAEPSHRRDGDVARLARRLARGLVDPDPLELLVTEGLTLELLGVAGRTSAVREDRPPAWLAVAQEVLHDRYAERLRVADVAAEAGVHPVHLARVFRRVHGVTPAAYLRELRLRQAARRLRTSDDPIATIAAEVGFTDQSHLTRHFGAAYGTTPARYRRQRGP